MMVENCVPWSLKRQLRFVMTTRSVEFLVDRVSYISCKKGEKADFGGNVRKERNVDPNVAEVLKY